MSQLIEIYNLCSISHHFYTIIRIDQANVDNDDDDNDGDDDNRSLFDAVPTPCPWGQSYADLPVPHFHVPFLACAVVPGLLDASHTLPDPRRVDDVREQKRRACWPNVSECVLL